MTFLPSLDWLDLSDNDLTGPMPPLPPSVRWLDLSNNQLSGGVKVPVAPRHGEDSQALVLMNVARNRLTGGCGCGVYCWVLLGVAVLVECVTGRHAHMQLVVGIVALCYRSPFVLTLL